MPDRFWNRPTSAGPAWAGRIGRIGEPPNQGRGASATLRSSGDTQRLHRGAEAQQGNPQSKQPALTLSGGRRSGGGRSSAGAAIQEWVGRNPIAADRSNKGDHHHGTGVVVGRRQSRGIDPNETCLGRRGGRVRRTRRSHAAVAPDRQAGRQRGSRCGRLTRMTGAERGPAAAVPRAAHAAADGAVPRGTAGNDLRSGAAAIRPGARHRGSWACRQKQQARQKRERQPELISSKLNHLLKTAP